MKNVENINNQLLLLSNKLKNSRYVKEKQLLKSQINGLKIKLSSTGRIPCWRVKGKLREKNPKNMYFMGDLCTRKTKSFHELTKY